MINVMYATPHLSTVGKVLIPSDDIVRLAAIGGAIQSLSSAIRDGWFTSDVPEVIDIITRAERASGGHLARVARKRREAECLRQD